MEILFARTFFGQMSRRTGVLPVVFCTLLAAACGGNQNLTIEADHQRLDARQAQFLAALAAKDADRTAELFADAATMHIADMPPIEGRRAIHNFYENMFGHLSASRADPDTSHLSESGDMAYGTGRTFNSFNGPDGPIEYDGKYALVWQKLADEWLIIFYGISSNQP